MQSMKEKQNMTVEGQKDMMSEIENKMKFLQQKYPSSTSKKENKKVKLMMAQIIEDAKEEDDGEENEKEENKDEENDDEEDFNTYSNTLDEQINNTAKEEAIKALTEVTEQTLSKARGQRDELVL